MSFLETFGLDLFKNQDLTPKNIFVWQKEGSKMKTILITDLTNGTTQIIVTNSNEFSMSGRRVHFWRRL